MNRVNEISLNPKQYEDNEYTMWDDIASILNILTKNDYVIVIRKNEIDDIFIEFETEDRKLGEPYPFWLSPEELETVVWDGDTEDES